MPSSAPTTDWYHLSAEHAAARLGTEPASGLTESERARGSDQYGPNEVADRGGRSAWRVLLAQFTGVLTLVLVAAAVLSAVLGDVLDAAPSWPSSCSTRRSGSSRSTGPSSRWRRSSGWPRRWCGSAATARCVEVSARELVPGDVVLLETGNVVPADGRLLQSSNLRVQEAALTGESEAVEKDAGLRLRHRRARSATGATWSTRARSSPTATARRLVTATGMATELGKIAGLLQSVEQEQTPLQRRLDRLGQGARGGRAGAGRRRLRAGRAAGRGLAGDAADLGQPGRGGHPGGADGGGHDRALAGRAAHAEAAGADPPAPGRRDAGLGAA